MPIDKGNLTRVAAFSLLELIIVLVLVSILAISLSGLTRDSVSSYIDAKDRSRLSQSSKWIIEKISREVREALPQSVRVGSTSGYYCLEFMAIVSASSYLNLAETGSISQFNAVNYNLLSTNASF
ncbi:MAG: prepilin-type N-terminal cleavage/methylation domain-containing protein [Enterobacterales bacterium]|nr:prepilin-type N-terminal cleavage/methylation domain-containing protein [Enterobacterales bacterium]